MFKNLTPFTDFISEINNTQVDTAIITRTNLDICGNIIEMSQVIL